MERLAMRSPDTIRYRFDCFEVDLHARVLFFGGEPVAMAPRTVDTLIVLLENAGRIMSKEELMRAIWPDRVVEEVNLTQHVSLLRRALAGRAEGVEYVRNYPSRGYQFVKPVEAIRAPSAPAPVPAKAPPVRNRGVWIAAAGLLVAIAAALPFANRPSSPSRHEPRRVPISRLPGGKWHPALSPDGTRIAFVWDQSGPEPSLWVKREDEEVHKQIPGSCGNPGSPVWSPDGQKLAYLRHRPSATEFVIHDGL
jgi:DNA-binding winged helix-turn-helix (wHTH) protein